MSNLKERIGRKVGHNKSWVRPGYQVKHSSSKQSQTRKQIPTTAGYESDQSSHEADSGHRDTHPSHPDFRNSARKTSLLERMGLSPGIDSGGDDEDTEAVAKSLIERVGLVTDIESAYKKFSKAQTPDNVDPFEKEQESVKVPPLDVLPLASDSVCQPYFPLCFSIVMSCFDRTMEALPQRISLPTATQTETTYHLRPMAYFRTILRMANALKAKVILQPIPHPHAARVTPLSLRTETAPILIQTTSICTTLTVHALPRPSRALQLKMERFATSRLQKKFANFLHLSCCKMPQVALVLPTMQDRNQCPSTWIPLPTMFVLHSKEESRTSARAWT